MRVAVCHPDRPHLAKGMCSPCYYRAKYGNAEIRVKILKYQAEYRKQYFERKSREVRMSDCHPEVRHYSRGYCFQCYNKWRWRRLSGKEK